jgi:hypothetical protein
MSPRRKAAEERSELRGKPRGDVIPRLKRRVTGASDGQRLGEGREVRKGPEKSGSFRHEGQVKAPPSHTWRGLHSIVPLGARDHVERHASEFPAAPVVQQPRAHQRHRWLPALRGGRLRVS